MLDEDSEILTIIYGEDVSKEEVKKQGWPAAVLFFWSCPWVLLPPPPTNTHAPNSLFFPWRAPNIPADAWALLDPFCMRGPHLPESFGTAQALSRR
jgi:hypothetical protein